ncbi:gem-associated protein 6 [Paramormyrops kingsleyae]|uniref:Gem-associated protein 6 n=1 Tax=Paramormyrops kingsleyae TaxID=1676925 RepID=A0A3B3TE20_9TELE|nr:gem-associated protein 6 [Paramormyrops kingsleyae]
MNPWRQKMPLEWQRYVNNEVKVVADEKRQYQGWVYTVDPVSASIVLVNPQEDGRAHVTVVMGHAVEKVELLQDGGEEIAQRLSSLFSPDGVQTVSREELQSKKGCLRAWLEKNRIPVTEEGEALCVAGVLRINPPYGSADCISSNEIILSRVQSLVESNPGIQG